MRKTKPPIARRLEPPATAGVGADVATTVIPRRLADEGSRVRARRPIPRSLGSLPLPSGYIGRRKARQHRWCKTNPPLADQAQKRAAQNEPTAKFPEVNGFQTAAYGADDFTAPPAASSVRSLDCPPVEWSRGSPVPLGTSPPERAWTSRRTGSPSAAPTGLAPAGGRQRRGCCGRGRTGAARSARRRRSP